MILFFHMNGVLKNYNIVLKMQEKILEAGERDVFRKGSYTEL